MLTGGWLPGFLAGVFLEPLGCVLTQPFALTVSGLLPRRLQNEHGPASRESVSFAPMSQSTKGLPKEQEQPEGG